MSTSMPLVCICMPTFNSEKTIHKSLSSILRQTYPNFIVHISDNASTDSTIKIIESMDDARVVIHQNKENIGCEANFNRCIELAEGKYTAIFHADDIYYSSMIAKQVDFLERNKNTGAVFTMANLINESDKLIGQLKLQSHFISTDNTYDFPTIFKGILKYSNFLVCPSAMVETEIYKKTIKYWREDLFKSSLDLDVWLRVALYKKIGILPGPLMQYRISTTQYSEKLRKRTTRSHFFLVADYYLSLPHVQDIITEKDLINYRRLEYTDRIVRAFNLYLLGNYSESKELCAGTFRIDKLIYAVTRYRGVVTFTAALLLISLLFLGAPKIGKKLLNGIRKIANK